jgi:hypothetical protein
MAKGRPDPNWQQKVFEWQASGKKSMLWCKENQIPYTTFLGWKRRFGNPHKGLQSKVLSPKGFIELKDPPVSNSRIFSGITIEYHDIKIRLEAGFNADVLKQCLTCLGGVSC